MLETVGGWVVELTARLQRAWGRLDIAGVEAVSSGVIAVRVDSTGTKLDS